MGMIRPFFSFDVCFSCDDAADDEGNGGEGIWGGNA